MSFESPIAQREHSVSTTTIPRYLFRVWSPNSDGENSSLGFKSLGSVTNPEGVKQLDDLPEARARDMIIYHVQWKSKSCCRSDVLISFTSSLYFAVQHCIRKINMPFGGRKVQDMPENSFITIVDTHMLDKLFLKTTALIDRYGLASDDLASFERHQHEQEYLAQWAVDLAAVPDCSTTVSLAILIKGNKLYQVVPQFGKQYQRRNELHESLQGFLSHIRTLKYGEDVSLTVAESTAIELLAACFSGRWRLIMHIWFLALTRRSVSDKRILQIFENGLLEHKPIFADFRKKHAPSAVVVTEEQEFMKLMTMAAAYTSRSWVEERRLPTWAPQAAITQIVKRELPKSKVPFPGFMRAREVHEINERQKITEMGFDNFSALSRVMDGRGI